MMNTRFSYEILDTLKELQKQVRKCKDNWGSKFDKLFAYTHTIMLYDVWMHDHESGWEGHKYIAALARMWKPVIPVSYTHLTLPTTSRV